MKIEIPAICEVQLVIWLLKAKIVRLAEMHSQIDEVYGEGAMNNKSVRKWHQLFKEGCTTRNKNGAQTVQMGNFWAYSIQPQPCTKWLSLYLFHICALISLYQINTDKYTHIIIHECICQYLFDTVIITCLSTSRCRSGLMWILTCWNEDFLKIL